MSTLIGKFGSAVPGYINGYFPDGDASELTRKGFELALRATGHGMAGSLLMHAMDAGMKIQKNMMGGISHPGTLWVYSDKVVFRPLELLRLLHDGVEAITIPAYQIREVELRGTLLINPHLHLHLYSGDRVRFDTMFSGRKIANAIKSII